MVLIYTTAILVVSFLITQALRVTLRRILPQSIYQYVAECLCVFQLTSCVCENGILLGNYGTWAYAAGMFCLGLGYSLTFDAYGNPAAMLEQMLKKQISIVSGILKIIAEVVGGLLAYRYILFVWSTFAPSSIHMNRAEMMKNSCVSALQVNLLTGMMAEALAMFISRSVAGMGLGGPRYYKMVNAFTSVVVVVSGKTLAMDHPCYSVDCCTPTTVSVSLSVCLSVCQSVNRSLKKKKKLFKKRKCFFDPLYSIPG